jgi:peptidoglycan-associated lipoprotein
MFRICRSQTSLGVVWWAFALLIAFAPRVLAQDAGSDAQTAAELLEDGMDAAADHATESARRLLGQLIADYPGSPEALRARRALAALNSPGATPDDRAAIRADEADRTTQYRRAFLIDAGDRVFFAESSATIGGRARSIIENQARWLKIRPDLSVTVIGRADDGGDKESARALSLERAKAVRNRLIASGVGPDRVKLEATGDQDHLAVCTSPICRAQNRNAEVFINDLQGASELQSVRQPLARTGPRASMGAAAQSGAEGQLPQ